MIKIEIEAATGAEAREHLTALLGQNIVATINPEHLKMTLERSSDNIKDEEPAKVEPEKTRTRRTKAQIEAEQNSAPAKEETAAAEEQNDIQDEAPAAETSKVQLADLQKKAVELGRAGKREETKEALRKFGYESLTKEKPVEPKDYEAVMAELEKL